jgi:hypothetical protein
MPVAAPKYPPMLDQLPPDLAAEAARVRIPFVRFADVTCVQPLEQVPWNT